MTPYDVAVIKSSNECARYLKSLGGVSGPEAISKLQTQKQTNSKSKITDSETKNTRKSDRPNEKSTTGMIITLALNKKYDLKSYFLKEATTTTTTTTNTTTDDSNIDEKRKTRILDDVDYTQTEESSESDEDDRAGQTTRHTNKPRSQLSFQQHPHSILNKRPIAEQRQMNKSNITESVEQQRKRDAVLAAQMAQVQVERERRRKQREQEEQAKRDERANHKMNNLQSLYTQTKSKSTLSRKLEENARLKNGQGSSKTRSQRTQNPPFLPSLNNSEPKKSEPEVVSRKVSKKTAEKTVKKADTPEENIEGVVKSKYVSRYDSEEEIIYDTNGKSRSQTAGARSSRDVSTRQKKNSSKAAPITDNSRLSRSKKSMKNVGAQADDDDDDYEDLDDENINKDMSDNTSLNEHTPRKSNACKH